MKAAIAYIYPLLNNMSVVLYNELIVKLKSIKKSIIKDVRPLTSTEQKWIACYLELKQEIKGSNASKLVCKINVIHQQNLFLQKNIWK